FRDSSVPGELLLQRSDGTPPIRLGKADGMGISSDGQWVLAISNGTPRELVLIPTGPGPVKKIPIEGVEPQQALLLPNAKGFLVIGKLTGQSSFQLFLVGPEGGKGRAIGGVGGLTSPSVGEGWAASPDGDRFAYLGNDRRLRVGPVSSGEVTTVPGAPFAWNEYPAQWSADGRFLFIMKVGGQGIPAEFDRLELATGHRETWKKLMPADPAGASVVGGAFDISRDGLSYAYSYERVLTSDLFVVEGVE
ncbi:MAG TPA: hypothetical protein VMH79_07285, partial [Thermoanaerobaculia bacterium]|nr:hypothetical protein [Thermoanaerobaculia bacterium]